MSELPYSYHTFLFPFLWNDGGKTEAKEFEKVLSVGKRWFEISREKGKISEDKSKEEWLQDYAAYQYFTEPANAAIFNTREDNVVRCFEYRYCEKFSRIDGKYIITKGGEVFTLDINNIRMHVYDSGVAILILELENNEKKHESLDAVNKINEYGRRINLPFITPGGSHPVCADRIEIKFCGNDYQHEDYMETLNNFNNDFDNYRTQMSLDFIMQPIQKLIDGGGEDNDGYEVTTKPGNAEENQKKLFIRPCVDDRMFVCCLVASEALSKEIKGLNAEGYSFLHGWDKRLRANLEGEVVDGNGGIHSDYMEGWADETYLANRLYKFLFIEKDVTCQNTEMKKELLRESIYRRWIDTGTLYATTHHSLMCIAHPQVEDSVIVPFLTEYIQLAILVLAQRATILAISGEAAAVANGLVGENITPEQIEEIEKLQAKYVKVQNQLFLTEATVQEQGVELYGKIKEHLYIGTNKAELDGQMSNIRDVANISNDRLERKNDDQLNFMLAVVSVFALILAVLQVAPAFCSDTEFSPYRLGSVFVGAGIAISIVVVTLLIRKLWLMLIKKIKNRKSRREK